MSNHSFWAGQRVLVTGATGFVGGWLCKTLLEKKAKVFGTHHRGDYHVLAAHGIKSRVQLIETDITQLISVQNAFTVAQPTHCFHLAGLSSPSACLPNPGQAFNINVTGALNVAIECARYQVPMLALSSVSVYQNGHQPIRENSPLQPSTLYGETKRLMEEIIRSLCNYHNLQAIIARPTNMFGPLNPRERTQYINNNILNLLEKKSLHNTPGYQRDFLFIEDAIDAFLRLAPHASSQSGKAFNISSGQTLWGESVVKVIQARLQNETIPTLEVLPDVIESAALFSLTGWRPKHSFQQGLEKTLQWYQQHGALSNA